jgi:hypothetical protein
MPVRLNFRTRWNGKPSREFQQGRFPLANFRSLWSRMRKAFAIRLFYPFKKATSISYIFGKCIHLSALGLQEFNIL